MTFDLDPEELAELYVPPSTCPIAVTLEKIGKKWSMTIIRSMIFGMTQFSDFLRTNPGLSSKVLAERLKELEAHGFIQRLEFTDEGKKKVEYRLTQRGVKLKRVLYAMSMFGSEEFPAEVYNGRTDVSYQQMVSTYGPSFKLNESEVAMYAAPAIEEAYGLTD